MSADPLIYCLERLTDYRQFERLASDLMGNGDYPGIEPLGGTGDGGRDALHVQRDGNCTTVFAYSTRSDWAVKFRADCKRISGAGHHQDKVVCVSTQEMSAAKKDELRGQVQAQYGWATDFYDIERIRLLLSGPLAFLVGKHPSIFPEPWFERRGGEVVTNRQHDLVVIDHLAADHAFAVWLYGRLSAAGYSAWCSGMAPLAGENADASIRTLIRQRAVAYLPVLSAGSARDANLRSRMVIAVAEGARTIPCWLSALDPQSFDSQLSGLVPARFDDGWGAGLAAVAGQLEVLNVARPLGEASGRRIALRAYQMTPLLRQEPEHLYSNVFQVKVPLAIRVYQTVREDASDAELERQWPHVRRGNLLFSFASPPQGSPLSRSKPTIFAWRSFAEYLGVKSHDLVKMLVKQSLLVACHRAGYQWCATRETLYLAEESRQRHAYQHVDGLYTHVSLTGERTVGVGERRSTCRFQLGPRFRVTVDQEQAVWVIIGLYVRVTDADGEPLDEKLIPSRRKRVTKNWWNREWLRRTLCTMQVISGEANIEGHIAVGEGGEAVAAAVKPLAWECPVSIDVDALAHVGDFQEELASAREPGDEDHPEDEDELHG